MANLKTIADLAGVSTGTASRILNEDQTLSVSSKTREAVITTAAQLKYQTPRARKRAAQKRDQGRVQGKFGVAVLLADCIHYTILNYIKLHYITSHYLT